MARLIMVFLFSFALALVLGLIVESNCSMELDSARTKLYRVQRELSVLEEENRLLLNSAKHRPVTYKKFYAVVTAYTAFKESTGKNPGTPGFNITASGLPGGYGVCAADPRYWEFGTAIYIKGLGACVILDTGGAIKGRERFDYMFGGNEAEAVASARKWGRRLAEVTVIQRRR